MLMKLSIEEMRATPPVEERKCIIKRAILEILIYSISLTTTLLLAVATRDDTMFNLHEVMTKHFVQRTIFSPYEHTHTYKEIATEEEWWYYIEHVFLQSLHIESDSLEKHRYILEENLLLGPPRLRQKRVRPNTCKIHRDFTTYFEDCYGHFTAENEETAEEYKGTKYTPPTSFDVLHMGQMTHLTDGGYVQDLTFDEKENWAIFTRLKGDKWIDRGTRLIVLEFVCVNENTKLFDNFKLAAEMPSIGGIMTDVHHEVIDMYTFWTKPDNYWVWFTCLLFYCCQAYYIFEETNELIQSGWSYFLSIWNYLDLGVIILCMYCTCYHFFHATLVDQLVEKFLANPDKFLNIDELAYYYSTYLSIYSICVFMQCLRLFKYFNLSRTMMQFLITIKRCANDVFGFFLMFGIIFMCYALVGMMMFCSYNREFRDVKSSILTTMKMIVGKFEYAKLEESSRVAGPIFFVSYILVVFFILMNMFLAILADTYLNVKVEIRNGDLDISSFLTKSFEEWLQRIKRRFKENRQKSTLKKYPNDREHFMSMDFIGTYYDIIGPHQNLNDQTEMVNEYNNHLKRLQRRITIVELGMEDLNKKVDIILEENKAIQKMKKRDSEDND